jgi:hypothetical protein
VRDGIGRFCGVYGPILGGLLLGNQLSRSAILMVFSCILNVSAIIIFSTDYTKDAKNQYKTEYGLCQIAKYDLKQRNQVFDFAALI